MTPLAGIKVVEVAQNLAGPFCGEILGSLGADVIKVEKPQGDDCRAWGPPFFRGSATAFNNVNLNKRSVSLDLEDPNAHASLLRLIAESDVLVHNMRPGAMEAFNLGPDTLRKRFPRLIYGAISGYGAAGPYSARPGYDAVVQATLGIFHLNGDPNGQPARIGPSVLDLGSGMWMALGILAALRHRDQTGEGTVVDTSLFETGLSFIAGPIAAATATGQEPARLRAGIGKVVPFDAFPTSDGEVVVAAANDRLFAKFSKVLGRPEWATDERFRTNADRSKYKQELLGQIATIMRGKSSNDWLAQLEKVGIPSARINTLLQALAEPQTKAVDILQEEDGVSFCRLPLRFDAQRPPIMRFAPAIGEHNEEILGVGVTHTRA
ncbi:CaiB/BaiF CoA-transferase family protein [Hydrogenophaga sp.]|uniref:CaiB/BaiF CoA transferase family protein n=1 Tax=Hydrogenophaga sp. TaxID=1904254 RepID=UPI00271915CD|nr:CoA transferase [Hydrogenophaga sp.]MDO9435940.1 CoA transferase [Hydrogenophaga sp.]